MKDKSWQPRITHQCFEHVVWIVSQDYIRIYFLAKALTLQYRDALQIGAQY